MAGMPSASGTKKSYSLFQRAVRLAQTSVRRANWWTLQHMPGLPNPPEKEAQLRQPRFCDLWEFTLADHRRNAREAWEEYRASFTDPSDLDLERSKEEVKRVARALRGEVESNADKNLRFLDEQLEGTQVKANLQELQATGAQNVRYLKGELEHAVEGVDAEKALKHAQEVLEGTRSHDDVATTLKKNVGELRDLAKTGRDAALRMDKSDLERAKQEAQSWFADKLLVGQSVLMAFIEGYREGKELELTREDALLVTMAKQAAEEHKDLIQEQLTKILDAQREKQRQEQAQEAAQTAADVDGAVDATKQETVAASTSTSTSDVPKETGTGAGADASTPPASESDAAKPTSR